MTIPEKIEEEKTKLKQESMGQKNDGVSKEEEGEEGDQEEEKNNLRTRRRKRLKKTR